MSDGTPIVVVPPATIAGIDFRLSMGGRIEGVVVTPDGQGISGAVVSVVDGAGRLAGISVTSADGVYVVKGLAAGPHFASVDHHEPFVGERYDDLPLHTSATAGTPVAVTNGESTTGIDFRLSREHTYYFAEGAISDFFDTRFAVLNLGWEPANVAFTFLRADGRRLNHSLIVPAHTRHTLNPKDIPGLEMAEFAASIVSDWSLAVDRTMTWDVARGYGAHARGVRRPGTRNDVVLGGGCHP